MYCSSCGKPVDANVRFCPACGAQISSGFAPGASANAAAGEAYPPPGGYVQRKLIRPRYPRMIAGVCSGFALQFGWDVTLVRVLTAVLAVLTSGAFGLAYLVAWVVIPEAPFELAGGGASYAAGYGVGTPPPPAGTAAAPPPPPAAGSPTA